MVGRVFVMPKQEVLDPQGQAVKHALNLLGYKDVTDVRLGKYLELEVGGEDPAVAKGRIEEMCRRLLANAVIEDYRVEVVADAERPNGAGKGRVG